MQTIPPATADKLANPAPEGGRHKQAMEIALPLLGNGLPPSAVFATLREKYASDFTDTEINNVIEWAIPRAKPQDGSRNGFIQKPVKSYQPQIKTPVMATREPKEHVAWWLSDSELSESAFMELSPIAVAGAEPVESARLMFELIYNPDEFVNIVCQFTEIDGKANPLGSGKSLTRLEWVEWFSNKGVPESKAGAWIRPNPCTKVGSGSNGAITDADTVSHRFLLLESDVLPLSQQLALFSKLKLPISVVVSSGGKSVHSWVKVDSTDAAQYKDHAKRILSSLAPFGIDQANKNSSRLSRLAGAKRIIGGCGDGIQRLLWLNPHTEPLTADQLVTFEESLTFPVIQEKPLKALARTSITRYEDLHAKKGQLGVMTGIDRFDRDSGGLKPGNFIVLAAETGGGKSTCAFNIINHCLVSGGGVALFSLEMDKDEIMDALLALNGKIDRNKFNTGEFTEGDIIKISTHITKIGNFPLWIFDAPITTTEDIRKAVIRLTSEKKIVLAVVDYVQLVSCNEFPNNREQQIAAIARGLRSLAKEAKLPLICLSQLNEEGKLRESRVLAHEAHIVFMLSDLEDAGKARIRVVKGRKIKKSTYDIEFVPEYGEIKTKSFINNGYHND